MPKQSIFICLPYRGSNYEFTQVYAGNRNPYTDGDILRIDYDDEGKPYAFTLVQEEQ